MTLQLTRFVDTSDASERAALIKVAFKALAVMQRAFNESSREDLRAVAIALYSGIHFLLLRVLVV
jgi:hypothetical protein